MHPTLFSLGCFAFFAVFYLDRFMDLPKLTVGKRYTLPQPVGSADALLIAQLGLREKSAGKLTAIFLVT